MSAATVTGGLGERILAALAASPRWHGTQELYALVPEAGDEMDFAVSLAPLARAKALQRIESPPGHLHRGRFLYAALGVAPRAKGTLPNISESNVAALNATRKAQAATPAKPLRKQAERMTEAAAAHKIANWTGDRLRITARAGALDLDAEESEDLVDFVIDTRVSRRRA